MRYAILVMFALVAMTLFLWQPRESAHVNPRVEERSALEASVEALRSEVAALKARDLRTTQASAPIQAQGRAAQEPPPQAQSLDLAEVGERVERRLETEARDDAWASGAEDHLARTLRSEALDGSWLEHAKCATRLCRAEIVHVNEGARERFMERLPMELGYDTQGFIDRIDDTHTRVYLAREGHALAMD